MAKKLKSKSKKIRQREYQYISKTGRLLSERYRIKSSDTIGDDRRRFKPSFDNHVKKIDGRRVNYHLTDSKRNKNLGKKSLSAKISFVDPKRVTVCQRRKNRRVSLFASGSVGSGKKVSKIRKRNNNSNIKC